jgi:hypothetical protein
MASCANCGTFILFGGKDLNGQKYCSDGCLEKGYLLAMTGDIPHDIVMQQVESLHQGQCPQCHGRGPVDIHTSYRVWSALVLTSWNSPVQISCRSCGIKSQVGSTFFCLFLGWWGFPFGLLMTPVQIIRNIVAMCGGPNPSRPSPELERVVRLLIAQHVASQPDPLAKNG